MSRSVTITIESVNAAFSTKSEDRGELLARLLEQIGTISDGAAQQRTKNNIFLLKNERGQTIADMAMADKDGKSSIALLKILHGKTLGQVLNNGNLNYIQRLNLINFSERDKVGKGKALKELGGEYDGFLINEKRNILIEAVKAGDERICLFLLKSGINLEMPTEKADPDSDKVVARPLLSSLNLGHKSERFYLSCKEKLFKETRKSEQKASASSASAEAQEGWDFGEEETTETKEVTTHFTPSKSFRKAKETSDSQKLASTHAHGSSNDVSQV
jgi:hypothetical protein